MTDTTTITTMTTPPEPDGPVDDPGGADRAATEAFAQRLFGGFIAGMEVLSIQLGHDLGLYRALDAAGWSTPVALAAATGVHGRYAREWLEQQAVAGILETDDPAAGPDHRRYRVPPAVRPVLVDEDSPVYLIPGTAFLSAMAGLVPRLAESYRTGGGIPFADYGSRLAHGIAQLNGAEYRAALGRAWLPGIPEIDAALRRPGARVLDVGCGHGVTSVEIARAYPGVRVEGVDLDESSVRAARDAAAAAGVADRVTFRVADAAYPGGEAPYDAVTIFEALHDMGDPVGALRAVRTLVRDGGRVLVADERVAQTFTAPGDETERFCYGASVLHCLPATMAESPVEASGTALRPATMARWAREAGYADLTELAIESPTWRFYLLTP